MRHNYLTFLPTLLLVALLGTSVRAQTTIAIMDFDGTTPEMTISTNEPFFIGGPNNTAPADGFFGIHNANADDTDGTPTDTGVGSGDVNKVNAAPISGDFLFVNDLDDEGDNGAPEATVTFGPVDVSGETNIIFSFDFQEDGFDGGDDVFYTLVLDGVDQAEVQFIDGNGSTSAGSIALPVPDGTNSVSLKIRIDQNGDDAAGFDNFLVTSDNSGTPCGITSFGPDASETCTSFNNDPAMPDGYFLSIDYIGIDSDATLAVSVDGTPVAFDISTGNDLNTESDGTLIITSASFLEGTSYEVVLTDGGGNCNFTVTGSVATDACEAVCDLSATFPDDVTITCTDFTSSDNTDAIMVEIDYQGVEPGATVSAPGLTISGDDPAVDPNGTIIITGLIEGGSYVVTINGGDCTGGDAINFPIPVPSNFCTPSDIVINEVLADPGSIASNDANNDGDTDGSEDEFIELFNTSETDIDLSGFTLSEGAGVRYTFPPGFILPRRSAFVLFGGGTPNVPCLSDVADTFFIGLNNSGDVVTLRNAAGLTVAQMSYGGEGGNDQSVALATDGDVASGYVQHTTIANPSGAPLTQSACLENDDPQFTLPIELLDFSATILEKTVVLDWSTENEIANDRFIVERSTNGRQWRQLGTVMASGQTAGDYSFQDEEPLNGQNIYRLRQLDLDGSFAIYGPVMAEFTASQLAAFPNPVNDELRLNQVLSPQDQLEIIDNNGRRVKLHPGNDGQINVSSLRPGLYLLRVERGDQVEVIRFIKQ